jgi:plastocyanin
MPTPESEPKDQRSRNLLLVVLAILAIGGVAAYFALRSASEGSPVGAPVAATSAPIPAAPPPVETNVASGDSGSTGASESATGTGTIKGVVRLAGAAPEMPLLKRGADPVCAATPMREQEVVVSSGKLSNVVVRISSGLPPSKASPATKAEIDQHQCMYEPRVTGVADGAMVEVRNGDKTLHNIHAYLGAYPATSTGKTLFNRAQPPDSQPVEYTPTQGGALLVFKCDVHPWMKGYVYVNQNRFIQVTGNSGEFLLKDVPAGSYTLEAWQERYGAKTNRVTVAPGGTAEADFTFGN